MKKLLFFPPFCYASLFFFLPFLKERNLMKEYIDSKCIQTQCCLERSLARRIDYHISSERTAVRSCMNNKKDSGRPTHENSTLPRASDFISINYSTLKCFICSCFCCCWDLFPPRFIMDLCPGLNLSTRSESVRMFYVLGHVKMMSHGWAFLFVFPFL